MSTALETEGGSEELGLKLGCGEELDLLELGECNNQLVRFKACRRWQWSRALLAGS